MLRRSLCCRGEVPPVAPYDAIVSGGGLVGASMMRSLQLLRQQLKPNLGGVAAPSSSSSSLSPGVAPLHRLMLVDAAGRPRFNAENSLHKLRTVSITPVSSKILENLGAWPRLANKHPYYRIAVRHEQINSPFLAKEERSTSFFMSALFGSSNTATPVLEFSDLRQPVGFVCYNTELQSVMLDAVEEQAAADALSHCGHDDLCFSSQLSRLQLPADDVVDGPLGRCSMKMQEREEATSFRLLVGCEGRGSIMRDQLSSPMIHHDYAQTAYVCDVQLEKLEDGNVCAYQNFFRDGMIIAMLPTSADSANIVFSTTPKHAKELMAMKTSELMEELNARLHAFAPADIPKIIRVADASSSTPSSGAAAPGRSQGCFPLRLQLATSPYTSRAVLLGDSAHGIHPFAGQGLNLGIYDVCSFTTVLHKAIASGHDIGNRVAVGQAFSGEMASHVLPMVASMEMIKASTRFFPGLSCLGMKAIDRLPLLSTLGKDAILQLSSGSTVAARNKGSFLLQ